MPVGDVNSKERGSGARFNDGKPEMALIPLTVLATAANAGGNVLTFHLMSILDSYRDGISNNLSKALFAIEEWGDVPREKSLADCAKVFEHGAEKYAAWNWARGMRWSVPFNCAIRHLVANWMGRKVDEESGLPHLAHFLCNIVMLDFFVENFKDLDDLPSIDVVPGFNSSQSTIRPF